MASSAVFSSGLEGAGAAGDLGLSAAGGALLTALVTYLKKKKAA